MVLVSERLQIFLSFYASIQFHSHHEYCTTSSAKRNSNSERRMNKIEYDIDFVPKQNAIC